MKLFSRVNRLALAGVTLLTLLLLLWELNQAYPLALPDLQRSQARLVTDRHGEPLRAFADSDGVWRYPATLEQVSPAYLEALLGYEDRWFWWHPGVNPFALLRASWQNLQSGRVISGGSTLSMQVARLLHPHPRTLWGKLQQLARTLQLEWQLSKREILTLYLNLAPFGGTLQGVQAASYGYLDKPAALLTDAEAALLAVLPQAPSRLRPDRHPVLAQQARDKVLARLQTLGEWPAARVQAARLETVLARQPRTPQQAPLLSRRLIQQYPGQSLITTTLDSTLQRALAQRVRDYGRRLPEGSSAAVLLVDNRTAQVLAYVGSADFADPSRAGHVDMVQAVRSPGSTLKPFLYGMALDAGLIHSESLLSDTPRYGQTYQPGNFSRGFSGPVSAAQALRRSLNIPAVNLLARLGPYLFNARLANAGVKLRIPDGRASEALVLGGAGTSLEQLVTGYQALAGSGATKPLRYRLNEPTTTQPRYLLSPGAAVIVHRMLQLPVGRSSRLSRLQPAAMVWKTGTSYGYRDSWALGVSEQYTMGVWIGRPDGTPLPGFYGRNTAVPLLQQLIARLPDQTVPAMPDTVSPAMICWPQGTRQQTGLPCPQARRALLLNQTAPPTLSDGDYGLWRRWWRDASGKRVVPGCIGGDIQPMQTPRWPLAVQPWLTPVQQQAVALPAWNEQCVPSLRPVLLQPLQLTGLEPGTVLRRAPGTRALPVLQLSTLGGQGLRHWYLDGQRIAANRAGEILLWPLKRGGERQLLVIDQQGQLVRRRFRVTGEGL
ncbi:MAG: penicillin-binding protein 1C [Marinobacterium sp.]|nr:penicillin-binding protein 1C [Marinobacterium sp.]